MKKEDLFKQWEELKTKEEDIDCIILLYSHADWRRGSDRQSECG